MISETDFIAKYHLDIRTLAECDISWQTLTEIYHDHLRREPGYKDAAELIARSFRDISEVHSVRLRAKDPEHLLAKLVRKKIDDRSLDVSVEAYCDWVFDLVGLRVLHLFKHEWESIHPFIMETWKQVELPTANIRAGDDQRVIDRYEKYNCRIREHGRGYRSVHYVVETNPAKEAIRAEFQVRTVFEEGWSEIDHRIGYPFEADPMLDQLLGVFNRLAGSADEMGTYLCKLQTVLAEAKEKEEQFAADQAVAKRDFDRLVVDLQINEKEKALLLDLVSRLQLSAGALPAALKLGSDIVLSGIAPALGFYPNSVPGGFGSYISPEDVLAMNLYAQGVASEEPK